MNRITLQAPVTKTGTFSGAAIDVSRVDLNSQNPTIFLNISNLVGQVRFLFNGALPDEGGPAISLVGPISKSADVTLSWNLKTFGLCSVGFVSATLSAAVQALTGDSASVTYSSWIIY